MVEEKTRKLCWYVKGLNKFLSSKGYVNWFSEEPMDKDFEEGDAYFFDISRGTFGRCGFIPSDRSEEASIISKDFKLLDFDGFDKKYHIITLECPLTDIKNDDVDF